MKRSSSRHGRAWSALAAAAALALAGGTQSALRGEAGGGEAVARGEYLVKIGSCNDCHTPLKMGPHGPEPDMSRMLSGHPENVPLEPLPKVDPQAAWNWSGHAAGTAYVGPFGVTVSRNLTPDRETGLGNWTEAQFVKAMREGVHLGIDGQRPILPPMPWPSVAQMTDADLHALWVYLQSIPAIRNDAPQSIPAPPPSGAPAH